MAAVLVLLLLVVPIAELAVIVQVAQEVGVPETILLLVGVSVAGAWLLRQQGLATWRSLQATMARGGVPTKEATDGALILFGGALLLTPGFVTDAVGLLLLIPPTRAIVKGAARKLLAGWAARHAGVAGRAGTGVYAARVTRVRRSAAASDGGATSSGSAGRLPPEDPPDAGGGSPDRG